MNVPADASRTPPDAARRQRRRWQMAAFAAVALTGVLIVLYAWRLPPFHSTVQSTENAYVRGQVTIISPQVSGYVAAVPVRDFQHVRRGQLLARIDDRIYRQRLDQALAQLQAQRAALANAEQQLRGAEATVAQRRAAIATAGAQAGVAAADLRRVEQLAAQQLLARSDLDHARAARVQSEAALAEARAALDAAEQQVRSVQVNRGALEAAVAGAQAAVQLARIDLANTRIVAPGDGQLGQVTVRQGAYVTNGTQLMALVPRALWVIANYKETQMARMRIGQPAVFSVDALGGARLRGRVQEISPAAGSEFAVLPPDNATGNFVKVAQRIPVKIAIDPGQPLAARLRPGMSVVASVETGAGSD
ncbi:HlyD family secretion protein [Vulcaniibacterium tengchongense]|uniref:Multidrug resistance efflux pump n=1 Tax=Vulcaniibacterium tengchongense TaxID=1273429 RepID=A0A3N4VB05_9GAMM|nr:HlyD family secretion protein [Vulcaniibacterium tengchongense]RPE79768.1 multidrug resistance efflux pump [Vulcaniibacterium tengchongense]